MIRRRQHFASRTEAYLAAEEAARRAGASDEDAKSDARAYCTARGWEGWFRPPDSQWWRPVTK